MIILTQLCFCSIFIAADSICISFSRMKSHGFGLEKMCFGLVIDKRSLVYITAVLISVVALLNIPCQTVRNNVMARDEA